LDPDRLNDNAANDREASEEEGHDRILAQKETLESQKTEVESALKRITDGTYGTCLNCGNIIEEKRLEIFPTATTCVDCQSKVQ
jgi:DnaK suppressor protein